MPEISGNRIVGVSVPMTVGHVVAADGEYSTEAVDPSSLGLVTEARLPALVEDLGIGGLPEGGTTGQVLQKTTTGAAWAPAPTSLPAGGTTGQSVVKQADGSAAWGTVTGAQGRGIKSVVVSTTDPTKATITYTDNTTEVITLPTGAAGKSIKSFGTPDATTGVSVVTFTDNTTTTITLPKGPKGDAAVWSKDAQAKAQGYWIVVSAEEPAEATYTTADGVTVPVIWQQPIVKTVPVLPQTPAFSRASSTLSVPELVGVVYRLTGWSKDNGVTWTTVSKDLVGGAVTDIKATTGQALPIAVRVEAFAKPGYVLPNAYKWTFDYPDPNATVILTSDTFAVDRTNAGGTPTTAALGGTAYTYDATRTGVVLAGVAESGYFTLKFGETKNFEVSFDLVGRRDVATNLSMSMRVATPRIDGNASGGGVSLIGDGTGNNSRRYDGGTELKYGGWAGSTSAYGTWAVTVIGDTFTIQPPNGGARETWTLTNATLANYGTTRGSNVAFSLSNAHIDNLIVKQAGY